MFNGLLLPYSRPIHPLFINYDSNISRVKVDHFVLRLKNNWFAIHNHMKTSKADLFPILLKKKKNQENSPTDFFIFPDLEENKLPDFSLTNGHPVNNGKFLSTDFQT